MIPSPRHITLMLQAFRTCALECRAPGMQMRAREVPSKQDRLSPSQVSSDGQPRLLSSHNLRAQLKRSLSATGVRLLRLAGVPDGDRKCQLVAVLAASTPPSSSGGGAEQVTCNPCSHTADGPAHVAPALQQKAQTLEQRVAAAPGTRVPLPQLAGYSRSRLPECCLQAHSSGSFPLPISWPCDRLTVSQLTLHVLETGSPSLLTKFWQSLPSALQMPDCRITPSTDAEAFLVWSPGQTPVAWSSSSGVLHIACADGCGCLITPRPSLHKIHLCTDAHPETGLYRFSQALSSLCSLRRLVPAYR